MKAFVAYTLLIIGIPMYLGLMVAGLIRIPIAWAFQIDKRTRAMNFSGVFAGVGTILAALGVFWLLGVHLGFAIPIICAAWGR